MAATKRSTHTLTDEQLNRLVIVLEQIRDMAELLVPHLGVHKGDPGFTAYNVIVEKAQEGEKILALAR